MDGEGARAAAPPGCRERERPTGRCGVGAAGECTLRGAGQCASAGATARGHPVSSARVRRRQRRPGRRPGGCESIRATGATCGCPGGPWPGPGTRRGEREPRVRHQGRESRMPSDRVGGTVASGGSRWSPTARNTRRGTSMRDESRSAFSAYTPNGTHSPDHAASGVDGAKGVSANGHSAVNGAVTVTPKIPANLAVKCPNCKELLVGKDWEKDLRVCKRCGHHFRLSAMERVHLLLDPDSFQEFASDVGPSDPLRFVSRSQSYREKLASERENTGLDESVVVGRGRLAGVPVVLVVMDFRFIGGSMGTVAGEKITRGIETAAAER